MLSTDHLTGVSLAGPVTERVVGDVLLSILVQDAQHIRAPPAHRHDVVAKPPGRENFTFHQEKWRKPELTMFPPPWAATPPLSLSAR